MISSDLLFQVDPIYTIYHVSGWDFVFIALITWVFSSLIVLFFRFKKNLLQKIEKPKYILPQINDPHFEEKISQIIRNFIGYRASYPDAFTAREIEQSQKYHRFLPLLQDIEKKEYIWIQIDIWERKNILDRIRREL